MSKSFLRTLVIGVLGAAAISAQHGPDHYMLTDLGLAGPAGLPLYISANGLVAGVVTGPDNTNHATLWYKNRQVDIGKPGLGGPNGTAFGVNVYGQAVGAAETGQPDPRHADFCGYKTYGLTTAGDICAPFLWQNGVMSRLRTLGGNNGTVSQINNRGEAAGEAENALPDPGCPQKLQIKPVKWRNGNIHELPTYPGDPDAVAYAINEAGQVVGASGVCADFNVLLQTPMLPLHPLIWQPDGTVKYLGTLGGTGHSSGNLAINLNNRGNVVGTSALAGDEVSHAFLWTEATGMQDLGTLGHEDVASAAISINDQNEITGVSVPADGPPSAFVWRNGRMTDLNTLVGESSLHLLAGTSINASGQIVGFAVDFETGELHAFMASPRGQEGGAAEAHAVVRRAIGRDEWRKLLPGLLSGRFARR